MLSLKKYDLWKERVADYRTSNLNAGEWCEKNNLSRATLRYWVTKFNKEKMNKDDHQQTNDFVKFAIQDLAHNPKETITINFNKLSINVSEGFDPAMLREVLDAIGAYD